MPVQSIQWHLAGQEPEKSMKRTLILYYGFDGDLAKELCKAERLKKSTVWLRDATVYPEVEPCDEMWVMPSVLKHHRDRLRELYGAKMEELEDADVEARIPKPVEPAVTASVERVQAVLKDDPPPDEHAGGGYAKMSNRELRAEAVHLGIDVSKAHSKAELIAALRANKRKAA